MSDSILHAHVRGYRPGWSTDSGYGVVLIGSGNQRIAEKSGYITGRTLTGEAEYRAVIAALELAVSHASTVCIITSSKLVYEQMAQDRPVKGLTFVALVQRVDVLVNRFDGVEWRYAPVGDNLADELARDAYRAGPPEPRLHSESSGSNGRTGLTETSVAATSAVNGAVTVRKTAPNLSVRAPVSTAQRTSRSKVERIEATAQLAATNAVEGTPDEIATQLVAGYPDELVEIWDNLPSKRYLSDVIRSSPLSWQRGTATL